MADLALKKKEETLLTKKLLTIPCLWEELDLRVQIYFSLALKGLSETQFEI